MALGQEDTFKRVVDKTNHAEMHARNEQDFNSAESKKRGFHPFRAVKKIFKRRGKHSSKDNEEEPKMASLKSRSTSELLAADDENRDGPSNGSNHLGSGLSMSHDSVFSPEHTNENDIRNAQSIQNIAMQKELMDRLHPHRDSDEDDVGLPYSPCTSPTTADVLQQGLREASVKSRSVCSDGSLLSMGSSENDEDSLYLQQPCQARLGAERRDDAEEGAVSFPLSHKAAHHKRSVRPKRTHAVGRHRKLQQLTVASLPATPEDLEESRCNSPDHSWPSVGEAICSSDSISRASSAMSTSDSADSFSAGTSPTLKKVLSTHSQEPIEVPARCRLSTPDWRIRQENENISRRRTVSESPCKEFDGRPKESTDTRADRAHSVMLMDSTKDVSWASASWSEYMMDDTCNVGNVTDVKKDNRSISPLWTNVHAEGSSFLETSVVSDRKWEQDSKPDDKATQKEIAADNQDKPSAIKQNSIEFKQQQVSEEEVKVEPIVQVTVKSESVRDESLVLEHVSIERRTIQRDPSYRVAVHDTYLDDQSSSISDEGKKEKEESSGLFSFGSKVKRNESAKDKVKKEEKLKKDEKVKEEKLKKDEKVKEEKLKKDEKVKEEKLKKDEKVKEEKLKKDEKVKEEKLKKDERVKEEKKKKEENESPFFSRFWGSRRSSKKKKDKTDAVESVPSENAAEIESQPESLPNMDASSPMSTIDVKAMIQSLTARTNSTPVPSIDKGKKPIPFPKKHNTSNDSNFMLTVESSSCSKSMESLSGPRSLDSAVDITLGKPKPAKKNKLSGSMPRLSNTSLQGEKFIYCDDTTEVGAQENVMIVEGEIVHLRKKSLIHADKKPLSAAAIEKPLNTNNSEHKRNSKRSSILSWYGKKESPSSLDYKPKKDSVQSERKQVQSALPAESPVRKTFAENSIQKGSNSKDGNKPDQESGIARLSGFWSSNGSAKENGEKTPKKLSSSFFKSSPKSKDTTSLQKRDSVSSSSSESSNSMKGMSVSYSEKYVPRTPSPDKSSRQSDVPEFMKLQLHKTRLLNETVVRDENSKVSEVSKSSGTPSKEVFKSSGTPSKELSKSSAAPSKEVSKSSGTPSKEVFKSSGTPSKEVSKSSAAPSKEVSKSSGTPSKEVFKSSGMPSREVSKSSGTFSKTENKLVEVRSQVGLSERLKPSSLEKKGNGTKKLVQPHDSTVVQNKTPITPKHTAQTLATPEVVKNGDIPVDENGDASSKFSRYKQNSKDGEPELMKVFHRRSLKIKDKDSTKNGAKENDSSATKPPCMDDRDQSEKSVEPVKKEELRMGSPFGDKKELSIESVNGSSQNRSSMADKRSISLSQETAPPPRVRTNTSPGIAMAATSPDIAKTGGDKCENGIPEWRRIAQQRREQREQRERQHVSGTSHPESSLILQNAPKHSGRSKVLDMVSNFQKLQVS